MKRRHAFPALALSLLLIGGMNALHAQEQTVEERLNALERTLRRQEEQNRQILQLLTAGQPAPAASTQQAPPPPSQNPNQYTPGWIARIYGVPRDFDVSSKLPDMEIGHFVADKSGYQIGDFQNILGVKINSGIMWRGEAFLYVKEQGSYTFTMSIDPRCGGRSGTLVSILVGGKEIARDMGSCSDFTVVGGATLAPGVHPVEFRCMPGVDKNNLGRGSYDDKASFILNIKGPADSRPRPAHEVLLRRIG